jgi:hypothetical protein
LRLGREDAAGEADASGPVADQERRSAVLVCGFRTGTALSIALSERQQLRLRDVEIGDAFARPLPPACSARHASPRDFFASEMAVIGRHRSFRNFLPVTPLPATGCTGGTHPCLSPHERRNSDAEITDMWDQLVPDHLSVGICS